MNYAALIQNRKSSREFTDRQVAYADLENLKTYYQKQVRAKIRDTPLGYPLFLCRERDSNP